MADTHEKPKRYVPQPGEPELPPQLRDLSSQSTEEYLKSMNRMPFFMTEIDETDGEGGENIQLEALKALAYDGEPDEVATNFKNQGNDCYKAKKYKDAVNYYTKALDVHCNVAEIDAACYLNRAACNLELKNYRRCINDCKSSLKLKPDNVKAFYRCARAFFAVGRLEEASECIEYAEKLLKESEKPDAATSSVLAKLSQQIAAEKARRKAVEEAAREREEQAKLEKAVLESALRARHITVARTTAGKSTAEEEMHGNTDENLHKTPRLSDPKDAESELLLPLSLLYPSAGYRADFVQDVSEHSTIGAELANVFAAPPPWFFTPEASNPDEDVSEYAEDFRLDNLECYLQTATGGLVKLGKKVPLLTVLSGEKPVVPLIDGVLRVFVLPKGKAKAWISQWDKQKALELLS